MGLAGDTLQCVQEHVADITMRESALILDAATGAGETTLQIAEAMRGGRLVTVDVDVASWEEWAAPVLKERGLIDRVTFLQSDICQLEGVQTGSCDLVVSHATLSAMGVWAADAIRQFHRVLKPQAHLVLADVLLEDETEPDEDNISALSWRLAKACAHLRGEPHYEELPTDWIRARLEETGFEVSSFEFQPARIQASEASFEEWRQADHSSGIDDETLRDAVQTVWSRYVEQATRKGLTTKEGTYTCWAKKP